MSSLPTKAPRFSRPWFRWAWKLLRAFVAESNRDFRRALQFVDEASEIMPLQSWFRVKRATLLLRLERVEEAHRSFDALRQEFTGSSDPNHQYLRHYCTAMLLLMQPGSGQWSYEAKQANAINCSRYVKGLLPMVSVDDIHDKIQPR